MTLLTFAAYYLTVYMVGADAPAVGPVELPATAITCGQPHEPRDPYATVYDVTQTIWIDPDDPRAHCVYQDPPDGLYALLASDGTLYEVTLRLDATPESQRSNAFGGTGGYPVPQRTRVLPPP